MPVNIVQVSDVSKNELNWSRRRFLEWVNDTLKADYSDVAEFKNGALYVQFFDMAFPGTIKLSDAVLNAESLCDCYHNYLILKEGFERLGIKKEINVESLSTGKQAETWRFLLWFKKFFDLNYASREYDPLGARGGNYMGFGKKVDLVVTTLKAREPCMATVPVNKPTHRLRQRSVSIKDVKVPKSAAVELNKEKELQGSKDLLVSEKPKESKKSKWSVKCKDTYACRNSSHLEDSKPCPVQNPCDEAPNSNEGKECTKSMTSIAGTRLMKLIENEIVKIARSDIAISEPLLSFFQHMIAINNFNYKIEIAVVDKRQQQESMQANLNGSNDAADCKRNLSNDSKLSTTEESGEDVVAQIIAFIQEEFKLLKSSLISESETSNNDEFLRNYRKQHNDQVIQFVKQQITEKLRSFERFNGTETQA